MGAVSRKRPRSPLAGSRRWGHTAWRLFKRLRHFGRRNPDTQPVFVFGQQRSGTTMLLKVLDMSARCRVYDERDPKAFSDFRLRDLDTISRMVGRSGFAVNVFKPLADSHRMDELLGHFPGAKGIWIWRHFADVGDSSTRRFPDGQRPAIRDVAEGRGAETGSTRGCRRRCARRCGRFTMTA